MFGSFYITWEAKLSNINSDKSTLLSESNFESHFEIILLGLKRVGLGSHKALGRSACIGFVGVPLSLIQFRNCLCIAHLKIQIVFKSPAPSPKKINRWHCMCNFVTETTKQNPLTTFWSNFISFALSCVCTLSPINNVLKRLLKIRLPRKTLLD